MLKKLSLLIDTTCQKTTVNNEDFSSDESHGIRCQKHGCACQFFNLTETSHRSTQQELLTARRFIEQLLVERCAKDTGSNCIYSNAVRRPFNRQRFSKRSHCRFACRVSSYFM